MESDPNQRMALAARRAVIRKAIAVMRLVTFTKPSASRNWRVVTLELMAGFVRPPRLVIQCM